MSLLRESVLHLVDRTQRFTPCWLWCGAFCNRLPIHRGKAAEVLVWEEVNQDRVPIGSVLFSLCGHATCVNPDHRLVKRKKDAFKEQLARNKQLSLEAAVENYKNAYASL